MRFWKPRKIEGSPKVGVAVAAYIADEDGRDAAGLTGLVASLRAQTYANWQAVVMHDGPYPHHNGMLDFVTEIEADSRVKVHEAEQRKQDFGHHHRQTTTHRLLGDGCEWVLHTNQDNYYIPVFLEWLLAEAQAKQTPFVYCDFVRSHKQWVTHASKPKRGQLDLGGFIAHKSIVEKVKFDRVGFDADGDYINRLVQAARGKVAKVPATLFVHN